MWRGRHQPDHSQNHRAPLGGLFHSARYARLRSTTRPAAIPRKHTPQMGNQPWKRTYKGWPDSGRAYLGSSPTWISTLKGLNPNDQEAGKVISTFPAPVPPSPLNEPAIRGASALSHKQPSNYAARANRFCRPCSQGRGPSAKGGSFRWPFLLLLQDADPLHHRASGRENRLGPGWNNFCF